MWMHQGGREVVYVLQAQPILAVEGPSHEREEYSCNKEYNPLHIELRSSERTGINSEVEEKLDIGDGMLEESEVVVKEEEGCLYNEGYDPLYTGLESGDGTGVKSEVEENLNAEVAVPEISGMTSSNMGADLNVRKQRITSQAKKIILQVHKHLREQDEKISETDLEIKTAATTGISVSSLHRIKLQSKRGLLQSPPPRTRKAPVLGAVDDLKRDYIRREILSFYESKEAPTIDALLKRVRGQPVGFTGCVSTLRKLVSQLGFRYRKVEHNKFMLMEKDDIVAARSKYLRIIGENRKAMNPKPEIYLDETWLVNPKEYGKSQNLADSSVGSKQKTVKADKLGIVHAGCENGFVPEAFLSFRLSDGNKGDYYNINHTYFQCWFEEQLLPYIPPHSLIVMDNARCHSEFQDKAPTNNSKKWEIIHWLTKHNISHDSSHTKSELLCLVKAHKHKQVYVIDEIAHKAGHEVVRIPLNHSLLNPIQLIWDKVNKEIKKNYSYNKEKSFQEITQAAIETVTAQDWKSCIRRTRKIENEYRKKDLAFEHVMENIENVVCIADESSDSDSDIYMDM